MQEHMEDVDDEEEEDDDDDVCTCGQVYSLGDEMYRKVKTTALMPLNKERLRKPYGCDAQQKECLHHQWIYTWSTLLDELRKQ